MEENNSVGGTSITRLTQLVAKRLQSDNTIEWKTKSLKSTEDDPIIRTAPSSWTIRRIVKRLKPSIPLRSPSKKTVSKKSQESVKQVELAKSSAGSPEDNVLTTESETYQFW